MNGCFCAAVGEVPLEWYKDEEHIGYDKDGARIIKKGKRDKLDALLARNDGSQVAASLDILCVLPSKCRTAAGLLLVRKSGTGGLFECLQKRTGSLFARCWPALSRVNDHKWNSSKPLQWRAAYDERSDEDVTPTREETHC